MNTLNTEKQPVLALSSYNPEVASPASASAIPEQAPAVLDTAFTPGVNEQRPVSIPSTRVPSFWGHEERLAQTRTAPMRTVEQAMEAKTNILYRMQRLSGVLDTMVTARNSNDRTGFLAARTEASRLIDNIQRDYGQLIRFYNGHAANFQFYQAEQISNLSQSYPRLMGNHIQRFNENRNATFTVQRPAATAEEMAEINSALTDLRQKLVLLQVNQTPVFARGIVASHNHVVNLMNAVTRAGRSIPDETMRLYQSVSATNPHATYVSNWSLVTLILDRAASNH